MIDGLVAMVVGLTIFGGIAWTVSYFSDRSYTQTETRDAIRFGDKEKMRSLLLMYPCRPTKKQRLNAELWLADKDGLLS